MRFPALKSILLLFLVGNVVATPRTNCTGPIRDVSSIAPAYIGPGIGPLADLTFPCLPSSNKLQISTTSLLSTNPKADDTATTATCADVLAAAETIKTTPGTVLFMRHGTTYMSQSTRESFTCKIGANTDLPCITAVSPNVTKSQDDWFVNPNPKTFDTAASTKEAFIGNERNPQRQIDNQGAVESIIIGEALKVAGVTIDEYISSAYDRAVNSARILQWTLEDNEDDNVKLYWNISGQFEKHAQVYNLSFSEQDFAPYWADASKTTLRFPDKNFRSNVWLNHVYRNSISEKAWTGQTTYFNAHGLFVLRALNIYNERGVLTVLSPNTDKTAETFSDEYTSDNDGNTFPFQLADTDNVKFEFQMAPSAFGALHSCTELASGEFLTSEKGLFALDKNKDFE
eukprot:10466216-Ditylum_brightwellii.AAC.1